MEEMIKRRIKEGNFSDVLPPAPEKGADREGSGKYTCHMYYTELNALPLIHHKLNYLLIIVRSYLQMN